MVRLAALTAALLLVALAAPAGAGGWAVTTLDAVPDRFEAGTAYDIGYTIRQHGVTPVDLKNTGIQITSDGGADSFIYWGHRDGPIGHYSVQVTFPAAGAWRWEAVQDWFGSQPLGKLEVAAPGAARAPDTHVAAASAPDARAIAGSGGIPATEPAPNALLIAGLLLALAGAAVLFGASIADATTTRARA